MLRYLPNHSQGHNPVFQLLVHGGGCVLSRVRLFVIPWNVARQAPLSMEFSRQEHWIGLPFPLPGDLPNPGIEPMSPVSPLLADRFFTSLASRQAPVSKGRKRQLPFPPTTFAYSTLIPGL